MHTSHFNFINWPTQYRYDSFKHKSKSLMSRSSSMSNAMHNMVGPICRSQISSVWWGKFDSQRPCWERVVVIIDQEFWTGLSIVPKEMMNALERPGWMYLWWLTWCFRPPLFHGLCNLPRSKLSLQVLVHRKILSTLVFFAEMACIFWWSLTKTLC